MVWLGLAMDRQHIWDRPAFFYKERFIAVVWRGVAIYKELIILMRAHE